VDPSSAPWRVVDAPAPPSDPSAGAAAPPPARATIVVAAGAIALLLGAAVVIASGGLPGEGDDAVGGVSVAASSGEPATGEVVVDVGGAVSSPGVYRLPAGSRVGDAVAAAGGFGPRVDAARAAVELNLAALLEDGAHLVVPSRDDATANPGPAGVGGPPGGGSDGPAGGLVDLNSATQAELEALPGIGPVTATKIIESRTAERFVSVDDLRTRKLVGAKTFETLRDLVTAR
jgi:competence protein ComEA